MSNGPTLVPRYRLFGSTIAVEPPLLTPAPCIVSPETDDDPTDLEIRLEQAPVTSSLELADAECLFESDRRVENGQTEEGVPTFRLYRCFGSEPRDEHLLFRLGDEAEFELHNSQIIGRTQGEPWRKNLELMLVGKVLALWHELNGRPALHAGSIAIDGSGIAFLGAGGAGKSTWTMAMIEAGALLLSDDLLIVQRRDDCEWAAAGMPTIRAWPEHFDRLVAAWPTSWLAALDTEKSSGAGSIQRVHPEVAKWRLPVPEESFSDSGVPLRHIFVLDRDDHAENLVIEPVSRRHAMGAVLGHSFVSRLASAACGEAERLERLVELIRTVPISALRYRSDLGSLPASTSRLFAYLEGSP